MEKILKNGLISLLLTTIFLSTPLAILSATDWIEAFKSHLKAGNVSKAISGAVTSGAAPLDILKITKNQKLSAYDVMLEMLISGSDPKEVAAACETLGIGSPAFYKAMDGAGLQIPPSIQVGGLQSTGMTLFGRGEPGGSRNPAPISPSSP